MHMYQLPTMNVIVMYCRHAQFLKVNSTRSTHMLRKPPLTEQKAVLTSLFRHQAADEGSIWRPKQSLRLSRIIYLAVCVPLTVGMARPHKRKNYTCAIPRCRIHATLPIPSTKIPPNKS